MNKELIRQLAEQAGLAQAADVRAGYIYPEGMEKFAELIIRECTNMLPNDSVRNEEGVHMLYVIRDHFGVSPYEGVR